MAQSCDVVIWAHWGGGFDYRQELEWLARYLDGETRWLIRGSNLLALEGTRESGERTRHVSLRDSYGLLPGTLREVGKAVGHEKLDMEFRHPTRLSRGRIVEAKSCPTSARCVACLARTARGRKRVTRYVRRDTEVLSLGIQKARRALATVGAEAKLTLAASVTKGIRSGLAKDERAYTPHGEQRGIRDVDRESEAAQFGGRVEPFAPIAPDGAFVFDIMSSYPAAMARAPLPWRYIGERTRGRWNWNGLGTTEAKVRVKRDCYLPVLPVRGKDGRLVFPVGTFSGTWVTEELAYAVEVGAATVLNVEAQEEWSGSTVLGDFMLRAWEERRATADPFLRYFWKIAMNSVYGKTVEGREKMEYTLHPKVAHRLKSIRKDLDLWGRETYRQPAFRNVVTGATTTARGRIALHRHLYRAIQMGGRIFYCDTDSIVTTAALATGDGLGDLKREAILRWGLFVAPKLYAYETSEGKTVIRGKGMPGLGPKKAGTETTAGMSYAATTAYNESRDAKKAVADFVRVVCGSPWQFDRSVGLREAINSDETVDYKRQACERTYRIGPGKRRWVPAKATHPLEAEGSVPWRYAEVA